MTRWLTVLAVAIGVLTALLLLPRLVDLRLNRVLQKPPYAAPQWAGERARGAVDLHADPLLWGRDLLARGRGELDVPRLREILRHAASVMGVGHVALGSDFDGAAFDVTGLPLLAAAMREEKF